MHFDDRNACSAALWKIFNGTCAYSVCKSAFIMKGTDKETHRVVTEVGMLTKFENWIKQSKPNKIYADPQLRWEFDRASSDDIISKCSSCHLEDDGDENEDRLCRRTSLPPTKVFAKARLDNVTSAMYKHI